MRLDGTAEERVGKLEGNDTTALVTNKDDGVSPVEGNMVSLLFARGGEHIAEMHVLILVKIIDVKLALVTDGGEYGGGVGCPLDVTDLVLKIKGHDRSLHVLDPHLDRPVSTATQEGLGVVWVPLDSVDGQVVILVGLQVELLARLGAQVNLALLSADQEEIGLIFIEIEAHAAGKTIHEWLFLAVGELLLFINNKLELDDLLRLELVLHEVPESDTAIRRDRVEAECLALGVSVPTNLPDRVGVLVSSDR